MGILIIIGIGYLLYVQYGEKKPAGNLAAKDILMKKYLNNEISEEEYLHKLEVINRN